MKLRRKWLPIVIKGLLLLTLSSCGDSFVKEPSGEIIAIQHGHGGESGKIWIEVRFESGPGRVTTWFVGSDTCRIGQIVTLK
jgi:hypothetical protein